MSTAHIATDHDEIRRWILTNHGAPARLTHAATHTPGPLRIDFLGVHSSDLEHLSWHDWFTAFDAQHLALSYPDPHIRGGTSTWFEVVHRGGADHR
ncbi:hypothetical protein ACFTWF_24435 [Rhodococcus sp. NPDC056960]|uniref:hypothetical protein n=1 Tax=Rhodococcus sp. NPDC056960 TaxID=3345982 RepID=UPI00364348C3